MLGMNRFGCGSGACVVLVALVSLSGGGIAWAQTPSQLPSASPTSAPAWLQGFRAHVARVPGGRVDWTAGVVIAEGLGRARGTTAQQRLMAARAAEVVAARNALAAACDVRIDADGRVAGIRDGNLYVQGVVRGHQVMRPQWNPEARPPEYRLELEVPLWGVQGVASLFWRSQQVQSRYASVERIALTSAAARSATTGDVEAVESVVVIDARGLDLSECLFPSIVDARGRVLYDLATVPATVARSSSAVRYVESDVAFERLSAAVASAVDAGTDAAGVDGTRSYHRMVVRALNVAGPQHTDLILAPADADALAQSAQATDALRQARVLIVVSADR